jgi:magnesium chelatase subunit D
MPRNTLSFPFSAVVGQDDVKLALLLNAVDPHIGGVLLRGQKGSAKSTLARGLATLLDPQAPFVELPVGATEDRVVGTVDMAAALAHGERRFQPGLLAEAHGGVLYVDEVNLLPDHLVDVLLDVAASGVNRVEREGVSHEHPSRFVLVGSMNPEEGELRPQLLDRFGLAVDVAGSADPDERAEAVTRRLAFDRNPIAFLERWSGSDVAVRGRLARAEPASLAPELVRTISALCASVGAEGLRADLVICRAAAAHAGWQQRDETTIDDVRRVAPLALAHRRRRSPFEDPGIAPEEIDQALSEPDPEPDPDLSPKAFGDTAPDTDKQAPPDQPTRIVRIEGGRGSQASGRRTTTEGTRGRLVADAPYAGGPVALGATARAAVVRHATEGGPALAAADLRQAVKEQRAGSLIVLAVDASGSMGAKQRMEAAKGAVLSILLDAYQRRDRVALVTFRGDGAEVALRPTGSVEIAKARLADLPTGGTTPLAAGISAALEVAERGRSDQHQPLLVLVTDGRTTAGPEPFEAAAAVKRRGISAVVIDAEDGPTRLGLAATIAEAMGARCLTVPELSAGALEQAIRQAAPGSGPSTR